MFTPEISSSPTPYSNVSSESKSSSFPFGWVIFGICAGIGVFITISYFCFCARSSSRRFKSTRNRQRLATHGGGTTTEDWNIGRANRNIAVSTNESNSGNKPGDCPGEHPVIHHGSHHHPHHGDFSGYDPGTCASDNHGSHSHNHHGSSGHDFGGHDSSHHGGFSGHDSSSPSGYDGGGFSGGCDSGGGFSGGCDSGGGGCSSGW